MSVYLHLHIASLYRNIYLYHIYPYADIYYIGRRLRRSRIRSSSSNRRSCSPDEEVIMTTTASGELVDYTETKLNNFSALVASDVALNASLVTTKVEQGSVILTSTIIVPQEIEATIVKSALETKWGTSALASDKLSLATGDNISVVAAPMLTINEVGCESSLTASATWGAVGGTIGVLSLFFGFLVWKKNRAKQNHQEH